MAQITAPRKGIQTTGRTLPTAWNWQTPSSWFATLHQPPQGFTWSHGQWLQQPYYFILDPNTTNLLKQQQTFPTQEQFYPHGQFSHIFMAHYVHVPYNVMSSMKLRDIQTYAHARHIVWSRMTTTRHSAYINNSSKFEHYTNQHAFTHVSPFIMIYHRQEKLHIEPTITSLQATQHIRAHEHLRLQGGLANMSEHEFYDLFLRPLEFLVTRGMPMHH